MNNGTRVVVWVQQKGGTGKSTLSYNQSLYLAESGKRVLHIDADEQANSSKSLATYAAPSIGASALFGKGPINLETLPQQIVLLRGDDGLRAVERSELDDEELVELLRVRLAEVKEGFDYVVIDTAGSNSRVANAFLVASDYAVLPCKIDPYSIDVAMDVLKRVIFVQKKWNPGLVNLGLLPNEYDTTSPAQKQWLKDLTSAYPQFMLGAWVSKRSAFREAAGEGIPVWKVAADTEDDGPGKVKTAARAAGKEIKAVFQMMQAKMGDA